MTCAHCHAENPEAARFCHRCGASLRAVEGTRDLSYVVQPGENLRQFALISTIMPHTTRGTADNYRYAFAIGGVVTLAFALTGLLAAAVVAAAVLVPVVYLVYIYDVNLWEDAPLPVVLSLFGAVGITGAVVSLVFFKWLFEAQFMALLVTRGGITGDAVVGLLLFAVLLPLVAEVVKQAGATFLASRPQFDDMIDGLTFGIASGTAYAAAETIVAFSSVFSSGQLRTTDGLFAWLLVIVNLMIVKSVIYGTASGIASATFSGLGSGYDGFTRAYGSRFLFAVGANVVYWLGVRLLSYLPFGQALGLLWGLVIVAVLLVRVRTFMQAGLLEAALEDAANDRRAPGATTDGGFCPECEMPLLPDSLFCVACGTSLRATSSMARHHIRDAVSNDPGGAA